VPGVRKVREIGFDGEVEQLKYLCCLMGGLVGLVDSKSSLVEIDWS
jgi:hypothetical protein